MKKISVIDFRGGNLYSVIQACKEVGGSAEITDNYEEILNSDGLILPGVGSFPSAMKILEEKNLVKPIKDFVSSGKPFFGICLGMQVMANKGFEGGEFVGIGWFNASVIKINPKDDNIKVPNIGWNKIEYNEENVLFQNLRNPVEVYFVHSYHMDCFDQKNIIATSTHGHKITAAINKDNIYGTQFHPEKSQDLGLQILENFLAV